MSYANKSHAHRDEKNDYSRIEEKALIEKELDLIIPQDDLEENDYKPLTDEEYELIDKTNPLSELSVDYYPSPLFQDEGDFCLGASRIAIGEYKRGVEASGI